MKKKNIIPVIFIVVAIILEALPYGVKLKFGLDNGETLEKFFSYFSLTPYGYANFLPFITAIMTCVLLVLSVVIIIKDCEKSKKIFKWFVISAFASAAASFAVFNFTLTAALIALMIGLAWLSSHLIYKA